MLYIISGIAKSGKSFLAKRIVKKYGIGSFSSDYLMMSLAKANPKLNIDIDASDTTVSNVLKPYLEAMMVTMIENKIDYLLEGVHFKPQMIREILDRYPGKIKSVFLGYRDIETSVKIQELSIFGKDTENHWYKRMNESELKNLVNYLKNESELLYIECQKYGFDYVEINNINDQSENIIHRLFNNE